MNDLTIEEFLAVDIRLGRILEAHAFPEARKPAFKLLVDFGPDIGERKASAQITINYELEELVGQLVLGVVNFPPRQIGKFMSEALVLGFWDENDAIVLATSERDAPLGARLT